MSKLIKIGAEIIEADTAMLDMSHEQLRELLQHQYPEVAHSVIRETTQEDGRTVIHFQAQPGRKG